MKTFQSLTLSDVVKVLFHIEALDTRPKRGGSSHRLSSLFATLKDSGQAEIARYGIERHLYYCRKNEIPVNVTALAEIIKDARENLNQAEQNEIEAYQVRNLERALPLSSLFGVHTLRGASRKPALS